MDEVLPPQTATSTRSAEPEWLADDDDDAQGKTVDDFERWKQNMRKNDGTLDPSVPAIDIEEPVKEIKPPPGFSIEQKVEVKSAIPPGFDTLPKTGSSKFSKFFSQSPAKEKSETDAYTSLSGAGSGTNKDDAEGFERILAMLSQQTKPVERPRPQESIMSQHTKNQDFFSSLLHQSQPERTEVDFLNQLMREQNLRPQHPYPPGYIGGVGGRPGPGWNGQYEVDPRIPQQRP